MSKMMDRVEVRSRKVAQLMCAAVALAALGCSGAEDVPGGEPVAAAGDELFLDELPADELPGDSPDALEGGDAFGVAANACKGGAPLKFHSRVGQNDYQAKIILPNQVKHAGLFQRGSTDETYGGFLADTFDAATDRIWVDYRAPNGKTHTQCGPSKSEFSQMVDVYDPVSRQIRVCIDTYYTPANRRFHACSPWWTDKD
jgi:hypothetical protein